MDVRVQKLVAEFLGTFALTFFGAGAIVVDFQLLAPGANFGPVDLMLVAAAHAVVLGVMVTALGHVSGAHFNPAVTFAALLGRIIDPALAVGYWVSQFVAAIAAAALLNFIFPSIVTTPVHLGAPTTTLTGKAFLVEAVLTFFLVTVIFATAIDPRGAFNKVAGFAIGLTLFFDIIVGGPLTGAAMNPARAFGPALIAGTVDGVHFLAYWLGPLVGASIAGLLYQTVFLREQTAP